MKPLFLLITLFNTFSVSSLDAFTERSRSIGEGWGEAKCPTYYGGVVYQARAVLYDLVKKQYSNSCETIAPPKSNKKLAQTVGENTELLVYPNPASNELFIIATGFSNVIIKLYNTLGELVFEKVVSSNQSISLLNLPNGIYTYKLYNNSNEVKAEKLIIIK